MGDHERRKAEIGLGLAAAGREEQQVSNLAIGMLAIGKASDIEQNERELERSPFGCRQRGRVASRARISPPRGREMARFMNRNALRRVRPAPGSRCLEQSGSVPSPCQR